MRAAAAALAAAALLAGCGAPRDYMGIALRAPVRDAAAAELQQFAVQAAAGHKPAQLELGIRFEEGDGVLRDPARARALYTAAARTTGGTTYVYQPPVRKGAAGMVVPITTPLSPGLPEAQRRLANLDQRVLPE